MKKLTAAVMKEDADTLMRRLMWLRCVQVVKTESEDGTADVSSYDSECRETAIVVRKLEKAIKILNGHASPELKKAAGLFGKKLSRERETYDASSGAYIQSYDDAERVEEILLRFAELDSNESNTVSSKAALAPWKDCDMPLDISHTKETKIIFGTLPLGITPEEVVAQLDGLCAIQEVSADTQARYCYAVFPKDREDEIYAAVTHLGMSRIDLRDYEGYASENLARLERESDVIAEERKALDAELDGIACRLADIRAAYDYTSTRLAQMEAKQKLYETSSVVMLTGWVPSRAEEKVKDELEKLTCCYEFEDPKEEDAVPVLLRNPSPTDAFESVVGMYSMPLYGTFDPTVIMAVFYFVIFGFMLADVVYGLILTIACALLYKFANLGKGTKNLIKLFMVCGVSCAIAGALFGSYCGDFISVFAESMLGIPKETLPSLALWFDPINNPILFLVLSIVIGVLHLMTGIGIQIYIDFKNGRPFEAIFDQGSWFLIFLGASVAALGVYLGFSALPGVVIVGIAALMLIFTQGRAEKNILMKAIKGVGSLYGIVNYVSDLLSYSRIMALGLSSAVVASVMNLLATLIGPSVVGYVAMIVIFIVGHLLNLAINLLGSFVHASRLQYIEFFGKFFTDGGKPFSPLEPKLTYTESRE